MSDAEKLEKAFDSWWNNEVLEHTESMPTEASKILWELTKIAWVNGAYIQSIISEGPID